MFAVVEGGHGGEGVMVVRGGDEDGVDFLHFLEHEAVVLEACGVRPVFERAVGVAPIDVAEGDDIDLVGGGELVEVTAALAADTDGGEVEFIIGGGGAVEAEDMAGEDLESGGGEGGSLEEFAARQIIGGGVLSHGVRGGGL